MSSIYERCDVLRPVLLHRVFFLKMRCFCKKFGIMQMSVVRHLPSTCNSKFPDVLFGKLKSKASPFPYADIGNPYGGYEAPPQRQAPAPRPQQAHSTPTSRPVPRPAPSYPDSDDIRSRVKSNLLPFLMPHTRDLSHPLFSSVRRTQESTLR